MTRAEQVRQQYIAAFGYCEWLRMNRQVEAAVMDVAYGYDGSNERETP